MEQVSCAHGEEFRRETNRGGYCMACELQSLRDREEELSAVLDELCAFAKRLTDGAAHKGEPADSPHNAALVARGDTIVVSEGDLWALLSPVHRARELLARSAASAGNSNGE